MISWLIYTAIIVTGLAFLIWQVGKMIKASSSDDPNVMMPTMAARAVAIAYTRDINLDYSPESIKSVEALLANLHEVRSRRRLTDREVQNNATYFGAYIGEVLRKKYNGSWSRDSAAAGPGSFPMTFNGAETYPVGWCGKRILNGDEDNVWHKFQSTTSGHEPPAPPAPPASPQSPVIKIAVFSDGRFTIDESPGDLDQLRLAFQQLAAQKGTVWYYREPAKGEPPPIAMQIMQEVVKVRLPIRLSSRPDYSDSIGPGGVAKPIAAENSN